MATILGQSDVPAKILKTVEMKQGHSSSQLTYSSAQISSGAAPVIASEAKITMVCSGLYFPLSNLFGFLFSNPISQSPN